MILTRQHRILNPVWLRGARINRASWQAHGLVAAWNPNVFPGGGTLYDRTGLYNGTISATWAADPRQGHYLSMTAASSQYIDLGAAFASAGASITYLGWFYPTLVSTFGFINRISSSAAGIDFLFGAASADLVRIRYSDGVTILNTADVACTFSQWHMVAGVIDIGMEQGSLFVDGKLGTTIDISALGSIGGGQNMRIARRIDSYYTMACAELRIYSRALSAAEIGAIYADPHGLWDLGEDMWAYAEAVAAAGNPHYYYQMLSKRRAG